jgi:plastocyanin
MRRTSPLVAVVLLSLILVLAGAAALTASAAYPSQGAPSGVRVQTNPEVIYPVKSDVSPPLRAIAPIRPQPGSAGEFPLHPVKNRGQGEGGVDSVAQTLAGPLVMPTPIVNFEGIWNIWGGYPPDTSGDVGPNHYLQIVNVGFQIFSKTGTSLYGPANNNTLFRGFGDVCETTNRGDPVGLYDPMADRFLVSWFAFTNSNGPTWQCVAVTAGPDPLGAWYRYQFASGPAFEDYPHLGVWPDAYYMTTNTFGAATSAANYAFERDRMLVGDSSARMVVFRNNDGGFLPSDLDGPPPPLGSPNYFLNWFNNSNLHEYKFHVDWSNTANSTFTGPFVIPVTPFTTPGGIPQPGTAVTLATLSDRIMYRLAYRNFGTHESLVTNHTVSSGGVAGVRWYEIRNPNGSPPTLFQQGTYAPGDGVHRWMGSAAMDRSGNLAIGFSASSSTLYPSIRYAGRLSTDPIGQLAQGEESFITGTGSQTGTGARWGDYSQINVDPTDDCTFWFTTEYIQVTGERTWRTRIGSFRFPNCVAAPPTPAPTKTVGIPSSTPVPASPTPCAMTANYTGSITNTDLTQTSRIITVGLPPSTCNVPRTCPGQDTSVSDQRNYDSYTYQNTTGLSQCVTVSLTPGCSNNALTSVAYLGTYDPANKCTNYIADGARGGPNNVYSFVLPAGQTAVVIVFEHNGGIGCETYNLRINPCDVGGPTVTPGATMTSTPTTAATNTSTVTAVASNTTVATVVPTGTPCAVTETVDIIDFEFVPQEQTINVGDTIMWTNSGSFDHTTTSDTAVWDSGNMSPGDDFSFTFNTPGVYTYHCEIHPTMTGTITVLSGTSCPPTGTATAVPTSAATQTAIPPTAAATSTSCPIQFSDVPANNTFYTHIRCLACRFIISGYSDGTFRPNNDITRGQIAKIVSQSAGFSDPPGQQIYEDVPPASPFFTWIQRLSNRGLVGGYPCGLVPEEPCIGPANRPYFRPNASATRGQLSKIVASAMGITPNPTGQTYQDVGTTHTFYVWIEQLSQLGVMGGYPCGTVPSEPCGTSGKPYFRPNNNVTRGQAAKIVANTFFPNCVTPSR